MGEEGSKTLVIIGVVLGGLLVLACLGGGAFFMLASREASKPVVVSVPPPAPAPEPLMLAVLPDAGVVLDDERVADAELARALAARLSRPGGRSVVIAADEHVPYHRVVELMDLARTAGFDRVALSVGAKPEGRCIIDSPEGEVSDVEGGLPCAEAKALAEKLKAAGIDARVVPATGE